MDAATNIGHINDCHQLGIMRGPFAKVRIQRDRHGQHILKWEPCRIDPDHENNHLSNGLMLNDSGTERERILMELSRNLIVESVARLMPTPPFEVAANRFVADAVEALRRHRVGCLLVTDEGKLVGIFTERDLLTRIIALGLPLSTPLRECMTLKPVTVHPLDSVRTAIERMEYGGYRHLPVVDHQQHPVGILSAKRILNYIADHFPATVYCQPPDPRNIYPDSPEGA